MRRLLRKLRNTEGSRQEGGCGVRGGRYEGGKNTYWQCVSLREWSLGSSCLRGGMTQQACGSRLCLFLAVCPWANSALSLSLRVSTGAED